MAAAPLQYTAATTYLEHITPPAPAVIHVPTSTPFDEHEHEEEGDLEKEESASSATSLDLADGRFLLSRVVRDGFVLELRLTGFTATSTSAGAPPTQLVFPSPLLASPSLIISSTSLQILAATTKGFLYAITLPLPLPSGEDTEHVLTADWSREYAVGSIAQTGRVPTLFHGIDRDKAVITCSDTHTTLISLSAAIGLSEITLTPPSSALLRLFSRPTATPILSFATSPNLSTLFALTQDRKLRVYSLLTGACLKSIDLPSPSSSASQDPNEETSDFLLPATPSQYLKLFSSTSANINAPPTHLVLHNPPTSFSLFSLTLSPDGTSLEELTPIGEHSAPSTTSGSLVDLVISTSPTAAELWTVWEDKGIPELLICDVPEVLGVAGDESWRAVDRGSAGVRWEAGYFDDLQGEGEGGDVVEVFRNHILYPARYTISTLSHALAGYEALIGGPVGMVDGAEDEYESVQERILATVGSKVGVEVEERSGRVLEEQWRKKVRLEWMRFVALCEEARSEELFPLALGVVGEGDVIVLGRDSLGLVVVRDVVGTLASGQLVDQAVNSTLYPLLSPPAIAHDIDVLLSAFSHLSSVSSSLESTLIHRVRTPFTADIEDVAMELWDAVEDLGGVEFAESGEVRRLLGELMTPEASFQALWTVLTSPELIAGAKVGGAGGKPSELGSALMADYLSSSVATRFELLRDLATLLLFVWGEELGDALVPKLGGLTSATFASLHAVAGMRWVVGSRGGENEAGGEENDLEMEEKFGEMTVAEGAARDGEGEVAAPSLVVSLLREPKYSPTIVSGRPMSTNLVYALSTFLRTLGLQSQKRLVVDSPSDVGFAKTLVELGLQDLSLEWSTFFPAGAGMRYVRGLALIKSGEWEEARDAFERGAAGLYDENLRLDESNGLSHVLPIDIANSLARYYRHVTLLFAALSVDTVVVRFAKLAIEAFEDEATGSEAELKDLWLKLFKGYAGVGSWEEAYGALMETPFAETKSTCLSHLISVMCEHGQVALLNSFSFVGLQAELERNLAFRARNSDPLVEPNYYKILYSYHISKGDYRSAGATMFQQGRRIGELAGRVGVYKDIATLQCQAYLAASNALALVDPRHAWVAVISEEGVERGSKRRKLTYHIPDDEFETPSKPPEVVDLADIRREYASALSRLQLSIEFPELERTNFTLDSEAIVALFAQTGQYEQAFRVAKTLAVDMASLFEILTEKCVGLTLYGDSSEDVNWVALNETAATWEGSLASKAWRLLEGHLSRHDDSTNRYRIVVLERALAVNRGGKLPSWLVDFFLEKDAATMIRTMLKFDRLADAFAYSLSTIKKSTIVPTPASTILPYSLFDQLLAIESGESPALSVDGLKSRQEDLRAALGVRFGEIDKAGKTLERAAR